MYAKLVPFKRECSHDHFGTTLVGIGVTEVLYSAKFGFQTEFCYSRDFMAKHSCTVPARLGRNFHLCDWDGNHPLSYNTIGHT